MTPKKVGLLTFLHGSSNPQDHMPGCANYDHDHGGCLFENFGTDCPCALEKGKRCKYFERTVLPTAAEIGQSLEITSLYEAKVHAVVNRRKLATANDRHCPDCNGPLAPRIRYCEKCGKKRRKITDRASQKKTRTTKRLGTGANHDPT